MHSAPNAKYCLLQSANHQRVHDVSAGQIKGCLALQPKSPLTIDDLDKPVGFGNSQE